MDFTSSEYAGIQINLGLASYEGRGVRGICDTFTATSEQTIFTLSKTINTGYQTLVWVNHVYVLPSLYTLGTNDITFISGLTSGNLVQVYYYA